MRAWEAHYKEGSAKVEWYTPRWLIDELGPFDLDPASPGADVWPTASKHYTKADDGLSKPWSGVVWMNPPYEKAVGRWMKKLADHGNGLALVFARCETAWFHETVWARATGCLFLRGRVKFHRPDGTVSDNAVCGSVLVAYGSECLGRLIGCNLDGKLVYL